jgi:aromatic ring-cleaving dioxygenase
MTWDIEFVRRDLNASNASGKNAHISFGDKRGSIAARHGREAEGEAVQLELTAWKYDKAGRRREHCASLSFTPEQWAELVEFVRADRDLSRERFTAPEVHAKIKAARAAS